MDIQIQRFTKINNEIPQAKIIYPQLNNVLERNQTEDNIYAKIAIQQEGESKINIYVKERKNNK